MRSVVVFPQPLGPSSVKNSPEARSRSRSSTARRSSKRLLTPRISTLGTSPFISSFLPVDSGLESFQKLALRPGGHHQNWVLQTPGRWGRLRCSPSVSFRLALPRLFHGDSPKVGPYDRLHKGQMS